PVRFAQTTDPDAALKVRFRRVPLAGCPGEGEAFSTVLPPNSARIPTKPAPSSEHPRFRVLPPPLSFFAPSPLFAPSRTTPSRLLCAPASLCASAYCLFRAPPHPFRLRPPRRRARPGPARLPPRPRDPQPRRPPPPPHRPHRRD